MPYHDTRKSRQRQTQFEAQQTETQTDPGNGFNGNGGAGTGNPVVSASLEALPGDWVSPFGEYVGPYHLMQDGTAMVGEGVLGAEHDIIDDDVIFYVGSGDSGTEDIVFYPLHITNLNPSRGDVSVNGSIVPPEGFFQSFPSIPAEEVTITTTPFSGFRPINSGSLITSDNVNLTLFSIVMESDVDIEVDFEPIDVVEFDLTRLGVRERVADIFYTKFFANNVLTDAQVLAVQTTIRDGFARTGRTDDEQLVFYKKDRNTLESRDDIQGESFNDIVDYIYTNELSTDILENNFTLTITDHYPGEIPEEAVDIQSLPPTFEVALRNYNIKYAPTTDLSYVITIATEVVLVIPTGDILPLTNPYFTDALNLSQIVKQNIGKKINPEKAREVLDTNIFELLPTQTTRQDEIDDFFQDFNSLIGDVPPIQDVDGDGLGEYIQPQDDLLDRQGRVSTGTIKSTDYITRLNTHANTNNQGKTLESMRNELNAYLGDVDNVVQVISDQRPEYENKSSGFLKIRKPNQAIILRNPNNDLLEFQKGNSYLTDGFTITMWVRFVGKTGRGTLFNFGNPLSIVNPYGFRLETITAEHPTTGLYQRVIRLGVRDHINETFHDNSWGTLWQPRVDTSITLNWGYTGQYITATYPSVPTTDLNEWFFICATFNPNIKEDESLSAPLYTIPDPEYANPPAIGGDPTTFTGYRNNMNGGGTNSKLFWQNHWDTSSLKIVANSHHGAKCKVEVISRSDLLRARGYKGGSGVGSLEVNVEQEQQEQEQEDTFTG